MSNYSNYLTSRKCCDLRGSGPLGPQGSQGAAGPIGPIGPAGPAGIYIGGTGATGATGGTGAQGSTGSKGETGVIGIIGPPGTKGATGSTGLPGPTGSIGMTGSAGPQAVTGFYGSFSDSTIQSNFLNGGARAITFNTTELSYGVRIGSPTSRIYIDNPGLYNFQFSGQLSLSSGGTETVSLWFRKNGLDILRSASNITIQNTNTYFVPSWNFICEMIQGDWFEIMCQCDGQHARFFAQPVNGYPAIPSIILTVTQTPSSVAALNIVSNTVSTEQSTTSGVFTDLATPGPSVTMYTGAKVMVTISAGCVCENSFSAAGFMGFEISGATTRPANNVNALIFTPIQFVSTQHSFVCFLSNLTPGINTFTVKYQSEISGYSNSFYNRQIIVQSV
jgi:hypothetical protein